MQDKPRLASHVEASQVAFIVGGGVTDEVSGTGESTFKKKFD